MEKRVFGFDLGIASIGWAVVDLDEEIIDTQKTEAQYAIKGGKIVASGVRLFDRPTDRQNKSLALIRGESRRTRASLERAKERLSHLVKIASKQGLIDNNFSVEQFKKTPNEYVWKLRKDALDNVLSNCDMFQVLYHIAKHRGFYFLTKEERKKMEASENSETDSGSISSSEQGKVKKGLLATQDKLKKSGYRTIGEYLYYKEGKKHNNKNSYDTCFRREDLKKEVELIFEAQRQLGNNLLTKEFEQKYIDEVLMYNHPIDEEKFRKMCGVCEFDGHIRFPKKGWASELFTFYSRLNNLKINDELVDEEKRQQILNYSLEHKTVTFSDLRKLLRLGDEQRFNLCSYREFNPEVEKTIKIDKNKIFTQEKKFLLIDSKSESLEKESRQFYKFIINDAEEYFKKYDKASSYTCYWSDLRKKAQLSNEYRFYELKKYYCESKENIGIKKYLEQFEKNEVFVSFTGYYDMKKTLGELFEKVNTADKLNDIAEALAYYKTDESRLHYLKMRGITDAELTSKILELNMKELCSFSRPFLETINPLMAQGKLFAEAKELAGYNKVDVEKTNTIPVYHGDFENNPTVARIIGQFRKVFNALARQYGNIDEIHIELATDVANSKDRIARILNKQKQYAEQKNAAVKRCQEYGIDPNQGDNLLRFRLAEEQDWKCIYSGQAISPTTPDNTPVGELSIYDCDIDHIIPISRSFDDSINNKVLCSRQENSQKSNKLPMEYFRQSPLKNEEDLQKFIICVRQNNRIIAAKKGRLLRETYTEEDMKKFIMRDLNNTRYASRHIAEWLRKYFDFSSSKCSYIPDVNRVRVLGGGITAKLRHLWGLEKDRDISNKHHAQDAIVIACTSFGHIYYICNILKELEEKGITRTRKIIPMPWNNFRTDVLTQIDNIFVSKMIRCSATGQLHQQPKKAKDPKRGTLLTRERTNEEFYAPLDSMFRYDIYKRDGHYYCVPIYAVDLAGTSQNPKPFEHKVQPIQKNCPEIADETDFVFSLYPDCYIEVTNDENETFCGYISQYVAQSGQFYLDSPNGDYIYEINTSTFEIGEFVKANNKVYQLTEYDEKRGLLQGVAFDGEILEIKAQIKGDNEDGDKGKDKEKRKGKEKYKTDKPYIKVDKEKKVSIATFKNLKKYQVGILGDKHLVKKESQRFTNQVKSNARRHKEKMAKRQKEE
jgi:CRISPR-associated endonuclease Csn1